MQTSICYGDSTTATSIAATVANACSHALASSVTVSRDASELLYLLMNRGRGYNNGAIELESAYSCIMLSSLSSSDSVSYLPSFTANDTDPMSSTLQFFFIRAITSGRRPVNLALNVHTALREA